MARRTQKEDSRINVQHERRSEINSRSHHYENTSRNPEGRSRRELSREEINRIRQNDLYERQSI